MKSDRATTRNSSAPATQMRRTIVVISQDALIGPPCARGVNSNAFGEGTLHRCGSSRRQPAPILRRRHSESRPELPTQVRVAAEPAVERDITDAAARTVQQARSLFNAQTARQLADGYPEEATKL